GTGRAGVGPRAGVAVVARRSVELGGAAADARGGVAGAGGVALVGGGAHDGVGAHARSGRAGVGPRACLAVVAGRAVGLGGFAAEACREFAGAAGVALVGAVSLHGALPLSGTGRAGVGPRAGVAVVARRAVELGGIGADARRGVADAGGVALVGGGAHDGVHAHAGAGLAGGGLRACVAVVAACSLELRGSRAGERRRTDLTCGVALVGG